MFKHLLDRFTHRPARPESAAFDPVADRDLIAFVNEARTQAELAAAVRTADFRLGRH